MSGHKRDELELDTSSREDTSEQGDETDSLTSRIEASDSSPEGPLDGSGDPVTPYLVEVSVQSTSPPGALVALFETLKLWLTILVEIASLFGCRKSRPRPWQVRIAQRGISVPQTSQEVQVLLQRQKDLNDVDRLADVAARFKLPESDFFADPTRIERLMQRILQENPPWLHISRTLAGADNGGDLQDAAILWREQETREVQDVTLFLPDDNWRDLPLASLTMHPVRHLGEVWQARLLDQILPPEVLVDRVNRGEILIPVRNILRHRLEFRTEQRIMEVPVLKRIPVEIEQEGDSGQGGQLLYVLLDSSASMRGLSATLALAAIAAALRANLGQRNSRYLFRRYAEQDHLWPGVVEAPIQARTMEQKDDLLDLICSTNFNGGATHVNHAIDIAITDVENLRREEQLDAAILLVTDGRAEMLESTGLRLRKSGVKLHTVMMAAEPNPSLAAISESFTVLDIGPDTDTRSESASSNSASRSTARRPSFQI